MKKVIALLSGALMLAIVAAIAGPTTSTAHETRQIADGQYQFVVGFLNEPAFQDELNAASVRVTIPAEEGSDGEATPVENLAGTLNIEVIFGDQSRELEVQPVFRDPGHYVGYFIPTEPGDYSFHITGEIDGVEIDEMFTAGPETFSTVEPRADYEFPARD